MALQGVELRMPGPKVVKLEEWHVPPGLGRARQA